MVKKTQILQELKGLDKLYKNSLIKDPKLSKFFSKLALLELCGWIEDSMDDIIRKYNKKILKEKTNVNFVEEFIDDTHGFSYKNHFRIMISNTVGIASVEKIERKVGSATLDRLKANLSYLKRKRDDLAHHYLATISIAIDTPSVVITKFNEVFEDLKRYVECLNKI